MKKNRIWVISEFYYPVVTSTGFYMTEIAEYLANKDIEVHVICTSSIYNERSQYNVKKEEIKNNVYIHRILTKDINKNNFIKRGIRLIYSSLGLFIKTLKYVNKNDKLLVVTNPAFFILLIPIIKIIKKIEYNLLVHDIFPENLAAIGKIKSDSIIYKCIKSLFDKAYSSANSCISIGRDMTEVIESKIKTNIEIHLIPNWADIRDVQPLDKRNTNLLSKFDFTNKFIFQFAGNLGRAQGIDNLLSAISMVKNNDIHFMFIGGGAKSETIKEYSNNNDNITLIGFQDRSSQNDFLNACDIAIVTLNDGMYGLGVPSKSYNIMAAGKPILLIADENSEISLCIKEYGIGWIVPPNNPKALNDKIEEIYSKRDNLSTIQENARKTAVNVFAKDIILDKYYNLLMNKQ